MSATPYVMVHLAGCGGIAFGLTRKLSAGDMLTADAVVLEGGRPGVHGEIVHCGTCGEQLTDRDLRSYLIFERGEVSPASAGG